MAVEIPVVFDAADLHRLAAFWGEALGDVAQDPRDGFQSWEAWAEANGIPRGATKLREVDEQGEHWVVLQDPEGNEFCLH